MSEDNATARVVSPVTVLWMVVIGVVSLGGWLVLSAYAPELRGADDPGAHALSRSAIGYAGLRELLLADEINRTPPKTQAALLGRPPLGPGRRGAAVKDRDGLTPLRPNASINGDWR